MHHYLIKYIHAQKLQKRVLRTLGVVYKPSISFESSIKNRLSTSEEEQIRSRTEICSFLFQSHIDFQNFEMEKNGFPFLNEFFHLRLYAVYIPQALLLTHPFSSKLVDIHDEAKSYKRYNLSIGSSYSLPLIYSLHSFTSFVLMLVKLPFNLFYGKDK